MGLIVIGEYIDRAQSGTTDSRAEFQHMIADSDKHTFEGVLVYQLDRFARNRYDSAINKAKLKKNGVRVISARENISDDASGILVEGVLESMAEFYSAEFIPEDTARHGYQCREVFEQREQIPALATVWTRNAAFILIRRARPLYERYLRCMQVEKPSPKLQASQRQAGQNLAGKGI